MPNLLTALVISLASTLSLAQQPVLTGQAAFTDYSQEKPGVRHHITLADLPAPNTKDTMDNPPIIVPRPDGVLPLAPPGFEVTLYANGFDFPRLIRVAPNGDLFLAESSTSEIVVLRGVGPDGKAAQREIFARKLDHPFGIAFYPLGPDPQWVYVANATSVVRFPYKNGDLHATGAVQKLVSNLPALVNFNTSGHWTKDVVFSHDGQHMLVSVGSATDDAESNDYKSEVRRADILEYTPEGKFEKIFASGIRNCVGEAINPTTGALWCSVNERNWLGENLVPDYISSIPEDSFFGWPWWYMGEHLDPRHTKTHPVLRGPVNIPDVLLIAHLASLEMLFYPETFAATTPPARPFPDAYGGDAFAAEHGSGNRIHRAGYEVIRVPMKDGHATGEYEDFLTGFTTPDGKVWGRPVGIAVGNDGSIFVSDDASKSLWRVSYTGK